MGGHAKVTSAFGFRVDTLHTKNIAIRKKWGAMAPFCVAHGLDRIQDWSRKERKHELTYGTAKNNLYM